MTHAPLATRIQDARTALVLTFRWLASAGRDDARVARLEAPGATGRPRWERIDRPTRPEVGGEAVKELDPVLQRLIGLVHQEGEARITRWWRLAPALVDDWASRLRLNEHVRKREAAPVDYPLPVLRSTLLALYPEGVGAVAFRFEWPDAADVEALARGLDRMRHLHKPYGHGAWRLVGVDGAPDDQPPPVKGSHAHRAGLSFRDLVNWLLGAPSPDEPVVQPEINHLVHHSAVVLERPPTPEALERIAFHLRRAYAPDYVPGPEPGDDRVLRPRGNRLVAVAREGSVAIGWPAPGSDWETNPKKGPTRWMGIYLVLAIHVLCERATLSRLGVDAAELMRRAEPVLARLAEEGSPRDGPGGETTTEALRRDLHALVGRMVGYSLTTTLEDPGGMSDYAVFFDAMRSVHRVPRRREELRSEVRELMEVIELFHRAAMERMERAEAEYAKQADDHRQFIEEAVAPLAAFAASVGVLSGIAGINFTRAMPKWSFITATAIILVIGFVAGLAVLLWRRASRRAAEARRRAPRKPRSP